MYGTSAFLICCLSACISCKSILDTLKYYELLEKHDIQHRIVRRDLSESGHSRNFEFQFVGEQFKVNLEQRNDILTNDFQASSVDSQGKEFPISIDKLQYYKGVVENNDKSLVIAHIENDMVTAEIISDKETLYIEPSDPHFEDKPNHMIIYRLSDVIWNLTEANSSLRRHDKNCMVPSLIDNLEPLPVINTTNESPNTRNRRNVATTKNVCELILVADFKYYTNIGRSNQMTTINYMIQVISRVHEIYRRTDFEGVGTNIGFKVRKILVHDVYSTGSTNIYNRQYNGPWNVDQLLTAFSRTNWKAYCLSHLFTYQDFSNGIIGLAYVASKSRYEVGGICTRSYRDVGGERFLNCGLSSSLNWGRRLLTAEADLVTAHEIGHNFGSNHDPHNCQSNGADGNYIMYAHSVAGDKVNNNRFSTCSKFAIGSVLQSKRGCFTEQKENTFCGNLIVEEGEDCDSGLLQQSSDSCCDDRCKFKIDTTTNKPFVCSDTHDTCCEKCQVAPSTKVCREQSDFHCEAVTKCSGSSSKCPAAPGLDGNELCGFSKGNCQKGNCTSLCKQKGKISCPCSSGPNNCKICCKDTELSPCMVLEGNFDEANGVPCELSDEQGQCVAGVCQKNKRNVENEFSSLLEDFSFSKFVRFMEANIVGTILILSLFVWIPASYAVHYIDKRQSEEDTFMKAWTNPKNKELLPKATPGKLRMLFRRSKREKPVRTQYHISS